MEGLHEGRESLAEVRRQFGILSDLHFCWESVCIARYIEEELNVVEVNFRADAEADTIPLLLYKMPLRLFVLVKDMGMIRNDVGWFEQLLKAC